MKSKETFFGDVNHLIGLAAGKDIKECKGLSVLQDFKNGFDFFSDLEKNISNTTHFIKDAFVPYRNVQLA
jgi:hypothetical protein